MCLHTTAATLLRSRSQVDAYDDLFLGELWETSPQYSALVRVFPKCFNFPLTLMRSHKPITRKQNVATTSDYIERRLIYFTAALRQQINGIRVMYANLYQSLS